MSKHEPNGPPEWRRQPGQSILNVQRWGEGVNTVAPNMTATEIKSRDPRTGTEHEPKHYGINADTGIYTDKLPLAIRVWQFCKKVSFRIRVIFGARVR